MSIASKHPLASRKRLVFVLAMATALAALLLARNAEAASWQITEFPVFAAQGEPSGIATGPEGNLWFTERGADQIGRITPSGKITEFPIPSAASEPSGIATGPEGNLWFTERGADQIGRITPSGRITEFPIPSAASEPTGIATGPEGNLWFTEFHAYKIGRMNPAGQLTEFEIASDSDPVGIAAGQEGDLWFTTHEGPASEAVPLFPEERDGQIGRITPNGRVTEFTLPTRASPEGITAGPEGDLWFTDANRIGRITPSAKITEFPLPSAASEPSGIATGPEGNLWFTERGADRIGRITPSAQINEYPIPSAESEPSAITAGSEGDLWFTERRGGRIGRITPGQLGLEIASRQAPVRGHLVKLELACAGGAEGSICTGSARISIEVRLRTAHRGHRSRIETFELTHGSYFLFSGQEAPLELWLNNRAVALLARQRRLAVRASASLSGGEGTSREVILQRLPNRRYGGR